MNDVYICDIPVYRCAEDVFYADMERAVAEHLGWLTKASGASRDKAPETFRNAEDHFRSTYGGPWTFNQVVGWIRLYAAGSHVGAHLWWVTGKRLQRKMRKTFYLTTHSNALATYFTPRDNSEAIFAGTLERLEAVAHMPPLKGRYVDLRVLRNVGPFINWRALLNASVGMQVAGH